MNFDKPIFKLRIDVGGLSQQRIDEEMKNFESDYNDPNYDMFFIPVSDMDTELECIYTPCRISDKIVSKGFDPNKPAFVYKINIGGLSKQRAELMISDCIDKHGKIGGNIFYIPVRNEPSDVYCVYNPFNMDL